MLNPNAHEVLEEKAVAISPSIVGRFVPASMCWRFTHILQDAWGNSVDACTKSKTDGPVFVCVWEREMVYTRLYLLISLITDFK